MAGLCCLAQMRDQDGVQRREFGLADTFGPDGMKLLGVQRHPLGQWRGQGDRRREERLQIKLQRRQPLIQRKAQALATLLPMRDQGVRRPGIGEVRCRSGGMVGRNRGPGGIGRNSHDHPLARDGGCGIGFTYGPFANARVAGAPGQADDRPKVRPSSLWSRSA